MIQFIQDQSLMSMICLLIASISVSISYKINRNIEFKFNMTGEIIVKMLLATSMLVEITGVRGDCNGFNILHHRSYNEIR